MTLARFPSGRVDGRRADQAGGGVLEVPANAWKASSISPRFKGPHAP
uniref:Uncharacterized protein n=1 Tax=Nonomuraea gerenzanensis TaxID=93944 RepID=A0A1M4DX70_9ACTN|nr:hypothetical protein BN4615_P699 [Nonomuraea gerenzanensis]